jgi:flagellin-like hook-associated protein FlgL
MDTIEGLLANRFHAAKSARIGVQGANGSNADIDRAQIGIEVKELTEQFRVLAKQSIWC